MMPFSSNDDLPARVKDNVPSKRGKDIFRNAFNSAFENGSSETVSFASAWAALENAGFERNDDGKWVKKAMPDPSDVHVPSTGKKPHRRRRRRSRKRYVHDDAYTIRAEAEARSHDLGFGGAVHTHQTSDGQAIFMPGPSHEAYLDAVGGDDEEDEDMGGIVGALREMKELLIGKSGQPKEHDMPQEIKAAGTILKADEEQRIVWGWASVVTEKGEPVVDSQGDIIEPAEMEKAANAFMQDARMAKAMHEGEGIGEVIHSLPLTKELGDALGIQSDKEGWVIAMKVHDNDVWQRVKDRSLSEFSIGGQARSEEVNA